MTDDHHITLEDISIFSTGLHISNLSTGTKSQQSYEHSFPINMVQFIVNLLTKRKNHYRHYDSHHLATTEIYIPYPILVRNSSLIKSNIYFPAISEDLRQSVYIMCVSSLMYAAS